MKRLTKTLIIEAQKMARAWKEANPERNEEEMVREIASVFDVRYEKLKIIILQNKRKKSK